MSSFKPATIPVGTVSRREVALVGACVEMVHIPAWAQWETEEHPMGKIHTWNVGEFHVSQGHRGKLKNGSQVISMQ